MKSTLDHLLTGTPPRSVPVRAAGTRKASTGVALHGLAAPIPASTPATATASSPRPKPLAKARYLILRRNTGELVLTTERDLDPGHVEGYPNIHKATTELRGNSYCFVPVPGPSQPAPMHKVWAWDDKLGRVEVDCKCRCHTRKGLREHRAELAEFRNKQRDPGIVRYTFEGGSSMGANLAHRVRRVPADTQARLGRLDSRIAQLQGERTGIIRSLWGDGEVLTASDLAKIATQPSDKKGPSRRDLEGRLEAKNTLNPEGRAR